MRYSYLGEKASPYILRTLARDYFLSSKGLANELRHSSSSIIREYLESMKKSGLVEEFYEIIVNVKHNRKHRLAHYLVKSESVKQAFNVQQEWIKNGESTEGGVDIKQNIIGRLLAVLICKECKKKLDYTTMGDDYKKYNEASCHVLTNSGKPVRHWCLTTEGIFYFISLIKKIEKIRKVKRLTRKYSDKHEVLDFASLLCDEDLQLLTERLATARKMGSNLTQEARKWSYEVNLDDKNYSDSSWKKILHFLKQRQLRRLLQIAREAKLRETNPGFDTKKMLKLGKEKISEIIQKRIADLKDMSPQETKEIIVLKELSKQLPASWHVNMAKSMGISQ